MSNATEVRDTDEYKTEIKSNTKIYKL